MDKETNNAKPMAEVCSTPMVQVCRSEEEAAAVSRDRVKPILLSGICNTPINPDGMRKMATDYLYLNKTRVRGVECVPTYTVQMKSDFFIVLREIADTILKGTVWNKKARIVLEYDPQEPKMTLTTFMEPDEAPRPEDSLLP